MVGSITYIEVKCIKTIAQGPGKVEIYYSKVFIPYRKQ